jgi:hypothetical protein
MVATLQIVDPDDTTRVFYDLNDQAAANSGLYGSVQTLVVSDVDLGRAALKDTGLDDVAKPLAFNRQATATMKMRVRYVGSSFDNLNRAVGVLAGFLADGCVMKWTPAGSSNTRLIDVLPSPTPALVAGRPYNLYEVTTLMQTPEGVELEVERLGYTRADKLDPALNVLLNPTMLRDSNQDGTPDSWTMQNSSAMTILATNETFQFSTSTSAFDHVSQVYNTAASGDVWTAAVDLRLVSGTATGLRVDLVYLDAGSSQTLRTNSALISATSTYPQRLTVTATAPASTAKVKLAVSVVGASSAVVQCGRPQLEKSSSASAFRVGPQTLAADPAASGFAQAIMVYNPSEAPAPCALELAFPDVSSKIVETDFALLSDRMIDGSRRIADYLNGPNYAQCDASGNGWTRTLSTNVTSVVDAAASGGNAAQYAPTSDRLASIPYKILSLTRTTLLDSMRGRWKVYAAVKAAAALEWNLQLNWGPGTVAGESNDAVTHDVTDATSFHYVYIDVGDIELPREKNVAIGQLTLELYAWQSPDSSGALTAHSTLNADHFVFAPTDDSALVTIPGESSISLKGKTLTSPPHRWTGAPVFTAGTAHSGSMRLNAADEAVGWGDNTVGAYTGVAGVRHRFRWDYHGTTSGGGPSGRLFYAFGIDDLTLDAINEVGGSIDSGEAGTREFVWDDLAHAYQPYLRVTSITADVGHIDVDQLTISTVPYIGQNGRLRSDPGSQPSRAVVEQLDSSGNLGLEADADGTPFWIPPGLSLIYVKPFEVANLGYNENAWTVGRTFTVTPTVYPRYWG